MRHVPSEARYWQEATNRTKHRWHGRIELEGALYQSVASLGHAIFAGPSRSGKSTMMCNQVVQVTATPQTVTQWVFDPAGSLASDIATHLFLAGQSQNLVWIDFSSTDPIVGYNPLHVPHALSAARHAEMLASVLLSSQGLQSIDSIDVMPRLKRDITFQLRALADARMTLHEGQYLVQHDEELSPALIELIENPLIQDYWHGLHARKPHERQRMLDVLMARLHPLWSNELLNAITSQQARALDVAALIESGKTIVVTGQPFRTLAPEHLQLMCSLLFADVLSKIFSRTPRTGVRNLVYVDEVGDRLVGPELAKTLRGSLKYKLQAFLGTQSLSALHEAQPELFFEILTNCATKVCFRDAPYADLELLARELALESLDPEQVKFDLMQLAHAPKEVQRLIHSVSIGGSETTGISLSEGQSQSDTMSASSGQTIMPGADAAMFPGNPIMHSSSGSGSGSSSFSGRTDHHMVSQSWSKSAAIVPFTVHEPFWQLASREFRSVDEQFLIAMQRLKRMPPRGMCVKLRGQQMRFVAAPYWPDPTMPDGWLERKLASLLSESPAYATLHAIKEERAQRAQMLRTRAHTPDELDHQHSATYFEEAFDELR